MFGFRVSVVQIERVPFTIGIPAIIETIKIFYLAESRNLKKKKYGYLYR